MSDAGMSALGVVRAATVDSARWLGLTDRGSIDPGLRADLVLLGPGALEEVDALTDVRAVWRGGIRRDEEDAR
jgi:imidazolonepropionase-like amidohydrolase